MCMLSLWCLWVLYFGLMYGTVELMRKKTQKTQDPNLKWYFGFSLNSNFSSLVNIWLWLFETVCFSCYLLIKYAWFLILAVTSPPPPSQPWALNASDHRDKLKEPVTRSMVFLVQFCPYSEVWTLSIINKYLNWLLNFFLEYNALKNRHFSQNENSLQTEWWTVKCAREEYTPKLRVFYQRFLFFPSSPSCYF